MIATLVAASALAAYRVVPLACRDGRLAIAGGAVLRLARGATCERVVPGRATAVAFDASGDATPRAPSPDDRPASEIPRAAFALAPAAAGDDARAVDVAIEVVVPPRTPSGDDVYLSTERSGWSPSEVRMDRVDARRYRLALRLPRGARLAFRVTRGTGASTERDPAGALPPAHVTVAGAAGPLVVVVAGWADLP